MIKLGIFGSCQLHLCSDFFINEAVKLENDIVVVFSIPFYFHDSNHISYQGDFDYTLLESINVLIIENNNLKNSASSQKIINFCTSRGIQVIRTALIKFPIYPINWSGYGENKKDYIEWKPLHLIDYKTKFKKLILTMEKDFEKADLGLHVVNFVENNFHKKLLFLHSLHPTNLLLYELWRCIFEKLNINIDNYTYDLNEKHLLDFWYNPLTTKMIQDLNIAYDFVTDDTYYEKRYLENKDKVHEEKNNFLI